MKLLLLLFLGVLARSGHAMERSDGFKVFRMSPTTEFQKQLLKDLESDHQLDFWCELNSVGRPVDVMVKPDHQEAFVNIMNRAGMLAEIFVDDVQQEIDSQKVGNYARSGMTWDEYYKLPDINDWLSDLEHQYPGTVKVIEGGISYEKRIITGVKISYGPGRRGVFLEGGIHAREWISPATLTYITNELLTSKDPALRKIAESFDWYIFPVTNPDGFVYSHWQTRYWRKTRTPYVKCHGADPNRNWDIHWMEQGTSDKECDDTFGGPKPFSESSVRTLSNFISSVGSTLDAYISFHSYSQLLMVPYGHTSDKLDNYNDTLAIGKKAIQALEARHGTKYNVGNIAETLKPVTGASIDWVKENFKTPLVYVYELRDSGKHGFLLPPEQIIPNGEEVVDSLIAMFQEAEKLGYFQLGGKPTKRKKY